MKTKVFQSFWWMDLLWSGGRPSHRWRQVELDELHNIRFVFLPEDPVTSHKNGIFHENQGFSEFLMNGFALIWSKFFSFMESSRTRRVLQHSIRKSQLSYTKIGFFMKTKAFAEWIRCELEASRTRGAVIYVIPLKVLSVLNRW